MKTSSSKGIVLSARRASSPNPLQEKKYRFSFYFVDIYFVLRHLLFPLSMVLIGFTAFCMVSPGKDMMKVLGDENSAVFHIFMALFISWWSMVVWYGSRIVLHYSHIEYINIKFNEGVQKWLPRIFGLLVFFVFVLGILLAKGDHAVLVSICYILIGFILFMLYALRRILFDKYFEIEDVKSGAMEFNFKEFIRNWKFIDYSVLLFILLFVVILISPVKFPRLLSPIGIIITAFAGWSALGLVLKVIDKVIYFPLLITLLICTLFFSRINFNNVVPVNQEKNNTQISDYFEKWYEGKNWEDTTAIFIITAEGGASRSAYWTARILSEIQNHNVEFYNHIFALTSVSGGSLGASTFFMLMESLKGRAARFNKKELPNVTKKLLSSDFLAPVTAGMLFPNLFQQFLPFRIKAFNRARYLQNGWLTEWKLYSSKNFENSFADYWDNKNYSSPLLVLNTTRVESGKRAVISYASFDKQLCDLEDVLHIDSVDANFTLQNAVSASAGFPYISPSTRIKKTNGHYWGNLVDGGYFENSSVYTAIDIYNNIQKNKYFDKVKVYFLVIRAFPDQDNHNSKLLINEEIDPLRAIMNTRSARSTHSFKLLENIVDTSNIIKIQLNKDDEVPVNWYLSEKALNIMENEIIRNQASINKASNIVNK